METHLPKGEWTDAAREQAVAMNTALRLENGRPPLSFEDALTEMQEYAETWESATNEDGSVDQWLNEEGARLDKDIERAFKGGVEGIESLEALLWDVEGMLAGSTVVAPEQERLRDLRDTLFTRQQELLQQVVKQPEQEEADAAQTERAVVAREDVSKAFEPEPAATAPVVAEIVPPGALDADEVERMKKLVARTKIVSNEEAQARVDANLEQYEQLPEEEKEFRRALASIAEVLRVMPRDVGLDKQVVAGLTPTQKAELVGLLRTARQEYVANSGNVSVIETFHWRLAENIQSMLAKPETVDVPESVEVVDAAQPVVYEPMAEAQAVSTPDTTNVEASEPQPQKYAPYPMYEQPPSPLGPEVTSSNRLRALYNLYVDTVREDLDRELMAAGVDIEDFYGRLGDGEIVIPEETRRMIEAFDYKPALLKERGNSLLGRTAERARQELIDIFRTLM